VARKWNDLSPRARTLIIAAVVADASLKTAALLDLRRRPADQVRGPKRAWVLAVTMNSAGLIPMSYFVFGRRRAVPPGRQRK
jgi:hypothetical protein